MSRRLGLEDKAGEGLKWGPSPPTPGQFVPEALPSPGSVVEWKARARDWWVREAPSFPSRQGGEKGVCGHV